MNPVSIFEREHARLYPMKELKQFQSLYVWMEGKIRLIFFFLIEIGRTRIVANEYKYAYTNDGQDDKNRSRLCQSTFLLVKPNLVLRVLLA